MVNFLSKVYKDSNGNEIKVTLHTGFIEPEIQFDRGPDISIKDLKEIIAWAEKELEKNKE